MDPIIKLNFTDGYLLPDPSTYRTLVGKLLYLIITRPNLSFVAQALSQYSHCPRSAHFDALIRVLRYIKLCPGQGLFFPANNTLHLTTYCNNDWASYATTRRYVSGYAIFLGHSLISWQSKKHAVVSRSSTEAEYKALANSTCEISWLKSLLLDLQVAVPTSSLVMCNNVSTITLTNNPIHHARTKYIEINCYFTFLPKVLGGFYTTIVYLSWAYVIPIHCQLAEGIMSLHKLLTQTPPKETAADPNTPTAKVQSLQRIATPPKMKLLLTQCLVRLEIRIKRYIDTKPNHELIHYCLNNLQYEYTWNDKVVPFAEGSFETTIERYMENYKNVSQDIRDQLNAEAEAIQIILIGIDNDIYSTIDACPNACEMWKAIER
nr:putative copia-type protein [Tanacetum cinerariifolium]